MTADISRGSARVSQNELPATEINEEEALWLRTLERYGQNARHWALAKSAQDIPECPVYRPTAAEFVEPGRYFQSILPQMEPYGMCKVVPPPGWTPQPYSGRLPKGFNERSAPPQPLRLHAARILAMGRRPASVRACDLATQSCGAVHRGMRCPLASRESSS